jgi:hypothetical protein
MKPQVGTAAMNPIKSVHSDPLQSTSGHSWVFEVKLDGF